MKTKTKTIKLAQSILFTIVISFSLTSCLHDKDSTKGKPEEVIKYTMDPIKTKLLAATEESPVTTYNNVTLPQKIVEADIGSITKGVFKTAAKTDTLAKTNNLLRIKIEGESDYKTFIHHKDGKVFTTILPAYDKLDLLFLDDNYAINYFVNTEGDLSKAEIDAFQAKFNKASDLLAASQGVTYNGFFQSQFMNYSIRTSEAMDEDDFKDYEDDELFSGKLSLLSVKPESKDKIAIISIKMDFDETVTANDKPIQGKPSRPELNKIVASIFLLNQVDGVGEETVTSARTIGKTKYGISNDASELPANAKEYISTDLQKYSFLTKFPIETLAITPDPNAKQAAQVGGMNLLILSEKQQPGESKTQNFASENWIDPNTIEDRGYLEVLKFVFASNERILPE